MATFSLSRWSQAVVRKAASLMFPRESFRFDSLWFGPGRTTYNYAADVQDGLASSVVMPCVQFMMRAFPEAPLVVRRQQGDELEVVAEHPLVQLVNRPNAFYPGVILWMATVTDWTWFGESYWRILRARGGQPAELWWIPPWSINPKWPDDGSVYISHYDYQPSIGTPIRLEVEEVIHFRHGLDPRNMRHGLPPLRAIIQDIWTDGESANFVGAMLRNMGIPGLIISPKGADAVLSPEEVERVQAYIQSRFTGDNRGRPMALGAPTDVQRLSLAPSDLALTDVRNTAEERVCAALGIPAAVIGFGTGLENSKVGAPQPFSARLWTRTGPTTMGEVHVGDRIAIPGGWGRIQAVYPQGDQDIYRITFQDGSTAESTLDHLWMVHTPNLGWRVFPLSEIRSWSEWKLRSATVPLQGVTSFDEQPILIPPYVLGLLLADGSFRKNLFFSNTNLQIVEEMRSQVGHDYAVNQTYPGGYDYRIAYRTAHEGRGKGRGSGDYNPFKEELRRLGLWMLYSQEKFIPDLYKYNLPLVRLQLLQGILDGDGYANLHGQPAIEQTSSRLADDITEVVQSLGGYTLRSLKRADRKIRVIKGHAMASRYDRVHLSIVIHEGQELFACDEKRDRCRPRVKAPSRKMRRIEFVRREAAQCIQVEGSLYLTDHFLVTHNTMHEFIGLAWSNGIVPMQRLMAAELQRTLLPLFESSADTFQVGWDYDEVKALETDQNALAKRAVELYQGGILMRAEARQIMGYEANDGDEIYLVPSSMTEEGPDAPEPEPLPLPMNGNGLPAQNGNGASNGTNPRPAEQRAAMLKQGSFDEWVTGLIARRAPRMDNPPASLKRLSTSLWRQEQKLQPQFQAMLLAAFQRYGELAAVAAQEILFPQKQNLEDLIRASIIHERIPYASITADLAAVYAALYDEMVDLTLKAIQEALELAPSDPARIQAQIQMISRERVGLLDLSTEARQGIMRILEESRQLGLDEGAMVDAIKDQLPAGRWSSSQVRAQIVARTEARMASNLSTAAVARDQGLRLLAFDGRLGPTDETCLPAGTTVVAIHPEKAFRRWFEGDLIDIETADGRFLSATGNHPILTRKGWVRADHLKEGDDVVCCLDAERFAMDATRQGGPDDKDMPASSHQGFNLSSVSFSAFSEGQPFTTSNLNSERRNSQVNTIATKSPLRDDSQATLIEPCPQELFIGAIELAAGFTSECRLDNIGMFLSTSENGSVSSTCLSEALFRSHMSIHKASRFGMSPQDISSLAQIVSDDSGTYTKLGANSFRGHAISIELPGQIDIDRLLDRSSLDALSLEDTQYGALADIENGRQLYRTLASQVTCDKIISIHIRPFVGHVYNLQTKDRWYIANNIITHNCEMRNGLIVSAQEAQLLAGAEHPNGTLGFAPISAAMMPSTT